MGTDKVLVKSNIYKTSGWAQLGRKRFAARAAGFCAAEMPENEKDPMGGNPSCGDLAGIRLIVAVTAAVNHSRASWSSGMILH